MGGLLGFLWQFLSPHIDTLIQVASNVLAPHILPPPSNGEKNKIAAKKQRNEEQARRDRAQHQLELYLNNLLNDRHFTQIHIVGMHRPLPLEKLYVQSYVHAESALRFTLDPKLREAEETHDPNILLNVAQAALEQRLDDALDPAEAIRFYTRCVIVGSPGAGKTTLLRYLAIKSARNELVDLPSTPIFVQLNTFDPAVHKSLPDMIMAQLDSYIHQTDTQALHELIKEKMHAGEILLLLDGLDETKFVFSDEQAERSYIVMMEAIRQVAAIYPQMPIVVTARKAGYQYHPKLQGFNELEIIDFRPAESKAFVANWINASDMTSKEEKIKDLHSRLERSQRVLSLVSNPLLLSLATIVYEGQLELPERRADFYKQCIDVLQSRWDASRDIKRRREFSLKSQTLLLQEVAWHFHSLGKRYFPTDELLQVIDRFLPTVDIAEGQSKHILEQICMESELLREQAQGWYGFAHLTFQEYFVTQYIIANNRQNDLFAHLNNPWWEEVLLLYAGSVPDAGPLLGTLLGQDVQISILEDQFYSHLILAGRCLAEKPRILQVSLRNEVINRLFAVLQSAPHTLTREQVANTLAMIGGPRVNNHLLELLSSNKENLLDLRESIGWAFGSYGEHHLAGEMADLLSKKETGRYIRIILARAIGMLGEHNVIETLLRVLSDIQEDIYVRQSIALTLGSLGDGSVAGKLVHILNQRDENALVQQSVVVALGMLGNDCVVATLEKLLTNEQLDWHIRGSAAKALGTLNAQEVISTMLKQLADNQDNTYVRGRIALMLGTLAHEMIPVDELLSLLMDNSLDTSVRENIAKTLSTLEEPAVLNTLLLLSRDEPTNLSIRIQSILSLGHMGNHNQQVLQTLQTIYSAPQADQNLRSSCAATLGMLGVRTMAYELLDILDNPELSQDILLHVIQALGTLGEHRSVDKQEIASRLAGLLLANDLDRYKGQNIVRLLCALGESSIVPHLLDLLENYSIDRSIRKSIAEAVAQLAYDEQSQAKLSLLLKDTDIQDDVFRALWAVNRKVTARKSLAGSLVQ